MFNLSFSQIRTLRAFWYPSSSPDSRFIITPISHFHLNAGLDVPDLRPFFQGDGQVYSKRIDILVGRGSRRTENFVVYSTRPPMVVLPNQSLTRIQPPLLWRGDILVYRCSKVRSCRNLVNMRRHDELLAARAVHRYVSDFNAHFLFYADDRSLIQALST